MCVGIKMESRGGWRDYEKECRTQKQNFYVCYYNYLMDMDGTVFMVSNGSSRRESLERDDDWKMD